MRLLYFSPASYGGLADYAHEQANALSAAGAEVVMLTSDRFRVSSSAGYSLVPRLFETDLTGGLRKKWNMVRTILHNAWSLAEYIRDEGFRHVLMGSYMEYLAPLWSGQFCRLADRGVVFGAVAHDPVRDHVVGPLWWHRWSVARGYSFLREVFVHEPITLDTGKPRPGLRTTVIPCGPFQFPVGGDSPAEARARWQLPLEARVALAFGHIHDRKNLDLVIQALARFPEVHLLVAGTAPPENQKPLAHYQALAEKLGVAPRIRWQTGYLPAEDVGKAFAAADLVLLTYSARFRSASAVLNAAVHFRKPALASAGSSNLRSVVQRYALGTWAEPDSLEALCAGLAAALERPPAPRWEDYEADNSWRANAEIVLRQMQ